MMSAFLRFPAEVWEMILDQMKDSQDVLNALQAFPELEVEGVLKRKRHLWMFDQVIPQLVPWLKTNEILACRQVCTQWSLAVDNLIDNRPSKRAYEHEKKITGQLWIPEASSSHTNHQLKLPTKLTYMGDLTSFSSMMKSHPLRNPVLGRSIDLYNTSVHTKAFWKKAMKHVRSFGDQVWFFKMGVKGNAADCQLLLDWLDLLPNLKSLELSKQELDVNLDGKEVLDSRNESLPPLLPHLESLAFRHPRFLGKSVVNFLVMGYSLQIRRLSIHDNNWAGEYSNLFPNLTELELRVSRQETMTNLLSSLDSPKLFRLQLLFEHASGPHVKYQRLFPLLSRFPQLSSFVLIHSNAVFKPKALLPIDPASVTFPSLKSLVLWNRNNATQYTINYESLKCFPSLEYLKITPSNVNLEEVWKSLPKLREVTVKKGGRERWKGGRSHRRHWN